MIEIKNIDIFATIEFIESLEGNLKDRYKELSKQGWRFFVVVSARGLCYHSIKTYTIPLWATLESKEYQLWYFAHEMSHIYAGPKANHGPVFMYWLKKICPPDCIHFELGYNRKSAINAGITRDWDLLI